MSPTPRRSDRRGIALILAVFALVVIAALISAVFFTAQLEERSGANTLASLQAAEAAQAGLEYASANWTRSWIQQGIGKTTVVGWTELGGTAGYFTDSVTQLNDQLVLVRGFGQSRNAAGTVLASRTGAMMFKYGPADFGIQAAFTGAAAVTVGGKDTVSGVDIVPTGGAWSTQCAGLSTGNVPAIRDSSSVTVGGSFSYVTPSTVANDATVTTTMSKVNLVFSTLAGMADINISSPPAAIQPALTAGHACDKTRTDNWGDPTYAASGQWGSTHPCASYFPVIYYNGGGTLTLPSGYGQGVLLVNGNLRFSTGFKFYGVIIVTGYARATGASSGNIVGALISQAGTSALNGDERFDYSSCAVTLAQVAASLGAPLPSRRYIRY